MRYSIGSDGDSEGGSGSTSMEDRAQLAGVVAVNSEMRVMRIRGSFSWQ